MNSELNPFVPFISAWSSVLMSFCICMSVYIEITLTNPLSALNYNDCFNNNMLSFHFPALQRENIMDYI